MSHSRIFLICAGMTMLSAAVSAGFSIAALMGRGQGDIYAFYAAARSLPLAVVVLGLLWHRSGIGMATMALTMGLIQGCDAGVGLFTGDIGKIAGPAVLAVATLASALALVRSLNT
jgi:hypothetical protein